MTDRGAQGTLPHTVCPPRTCKVAESAGRGPFAGAGRPRSGDAEYPVQKRPPSVPTALGTSTG